MSTPNTDVPKETAAPAPAEATKAAETVTPEEKTDAEPGTTKVNDMKETPVLLHTIVVRDAKAALKWYCEALGGSVSFRYDDDKTGMVLHSIVTTDYGLHVGIEDHRPDMHMVTPAEAGGHAAGCSYVYVCIPKGKGTADQAVERMREAGGTVVMEPTDMFYGHRLGKIVDAWGIAWAFAHAIEVSNDKK